MTDLLSYIEASKRAESGSTRAAEHADAVSPNWSADAESLVVEYARMRHSPFLAEEAREWILGDKQGIGAPPDGRAWGAVIKRAAKKGLIVRVGYEKARSSNNSPKCLWRAA